MATALLSSLRTSTASLCGGALRLLTFHTMGGDLACWPSHTAASGDFLTRGAVTVVGDGGADDRNEDDSAGPGYDDDRARGRGWCGRIGCGRSGDVAGSSSPQNDVRASALWRLPLDRVRLSKSWTLHALLRVTLTMAMGLWSRVAARYAVKLSWEICLHSWKLPLHGRSVERTRTRSALRTSSRVARISSLSVAARGAAGEVVHLRRSWDDIACRCIAGCMRGGGCAGLGNAECWRRRELGDDGRLLPVADGADEREGDSGGRPAKTELERADVEQLVPGEHGREGEDEVRARC